MRGNALSNSPTVEGRGGPGWGAVRIGEGCEAAWRSSAPVPSGALLGRACTPRGSENWGILGPTAHLLLNQPGRITGTKGLGAPPALFAAARAATRDHHLQRGVAAPVHARSRGMAAPSSSVDLVRRLVDRAVSSVPIADDPSAGAQARKHLLSLALRLLGSGVSLSVLQDEASIADSIRMAVRTGGQPGRATRFDELHTKLMHIGLEPEFRTRVLLMLFLIAKDRQRERGVVNAEMSLRASWVSQDGGLRALRQSAPGTSIMQQPVPESNGFAPSLGYPSTRTLQSSQQIHKQLVALPQAVGPGVEPQASFGVKEPALVRDVLYICQGIDGQYIRYEPNSVAGGGFVIDSSAGVGPVQTKLVLRLCELGWLFRKVHYSLQSRWAQTGGAVRQAVCYAFSKELADYYRLMAVLEAQSATPLPTALHDDRQQFRENDGACLRGSRQSGRIAPGSHAPYLSLRRLAVWLAEPIRRMRLLAIIIDSTKDKTGGELAGAIYSYLQQGDPTTQTFLKRILQRVCVPLFDMIKQWVFEGELCDQHREFFIQDNRQLQWSDSDPPTFVDLWRDGYKINAAMLPAFVSEQLAKKILRAGKTINFLREWCDDVEWVQERAAEAQASGRMSMTYGQLESLQELVDSASALVDQRLMDILYMKYSFTLHCEAIKRYLLLGQGDFIQALMDFLKPELNKDASKVSEITLIGLLKVAVHASNAKYEDDDVLERLRVRKDRGIGTDTGWDVFFLEYVVAQPLSTIFTTRVMSQYLRVFRLLWKLKHAEHTLAEVWRTLKLMDRILNSFGPRSGNRARSLLRHGLKLRSKMSHFVTNLQYYIMFEVLEGSWHKFTECAQTATDLDELIAAHERYLDAILTRCLLAGQVEKIQQKLEEIFKCVVRVLGVVNRLNGEVDAAAEAIRMQEERVKRRTQKGGWGTGKVDGNPEKDIQEKDYFDIKRVIDNVVLEYEVLLNQFTKDLPVQALADLRFLVFRLDLTEFYTKTGGDTQDDEFDG